MWGQIIGAGIGMLGARKAAKDDRAAMSEANRLNRESFTMAKPYIEDMYKSGSEELNKIKGAGSYSGSTYAGANPYATNAYNTMGGFTPGMMNDANAMMNIGKGYAGNYQDMYNRAAGGTTLADAQKYATENSGALVDAAMRDPRRQLEEQTLTGIDQGAAMSGNTNNTRAMMAGAIANRGFNDRRADVGAQINQQLINQYTAQANADRTAAANANLGLANAYKTGFGKMGDAMAYGVGAGEGLQGYSQAEMDDAAKRYYDDLYFNQNANKDFSSGILSNASYTPPSVKANMVNPMTAGFGGAMSGFGVGGKVQDWWRSR